MKCVYFLFFLITFANAQAEVKNDSSKIIQKLNDPSALKNIMFNVSIEKSNKYCNFLISELKIVNHKHVVGRNKNNKEYQSTMHMINCIRILRAITGQKFYAKTEYEFNLQKEKNRIYWLHNDKKNEVPFFSTWMSRDSVFIAPVDAQKEIIEKWKQWYMKNKVNKFSPNYDINFWYF